MAATFTRQPTRFADIGLLLAPPAALGPPAPRDRRETTTRDRGHGRHDEVRHLIAVT